MPLLAIKKIIFRNKGFTFVEMLIVLGIIALFSGLAMINYSGQNQKLRLRTTVQETVNKLRQTQNFSVSTKISGAEVPGGGYGIRFDKAANSYTIFADKIDPPNRTFDAGEQIETKVLNSDLEISDITLSSSGSVNTLDAVFAPPDPITYLNASKVFDLSAVITFRIKGKTCPQSCRTITVKTSGVVE